MPNRYYQPKRTILLTGAGFSKPFGGYLASEMWSIIFNQLNSPDAAELRTVLRAELNYERVYDLVMNGVGDFGPAEQLIFTNALTAAYTELDRSIQIHFINNVTQIQTISNFIHRFGGQGHERGFVFTLNQDLLLERFLSHGNNLVQIPALSHPDWFSGRLKDQKDPETDISKPLEFEKVRNNFWGKGTGLRNFLYMKLHGSYGWKSSEHGKSMVIGYDKTGSIAKEPLLKWYLEIFAEVLSTKNITLVVVGYGFRDRHINELIFKAAETGLQLHVVSPMQPNDFKSYLLSHGPISGSLPLPYGQQIWEILCGYHCTSVEKMVLPRGGALPGEAFFNNVGI